MSANRRETASLRPMAHAILDDFPLDGLEHIDRDDLATSLVRQWVTYDGAATLLSAREQLHFRIVEHDSAGRKVAVDRISTEQWFRQCMRDWQFDEDTLDSILPQLNRGQAAVLTNRRGEQLRLWVNPQERSKGIEPIDTTAAAGTQRCPYRTLAIDALEGIFGEPLAPEVKNDLATALSRQWIATDGHGMILTAGTTYSIALIPTSGGGRCMETKEKPASTGDDLLRCGVAPDRIGEIVHRLNLGHTPEIRDSQGRHYRLIANSKLLAVEWESIGEQLRPAGPWFRVEVG